jgi:hypothetical protein
LRGGCCGAGASQARVAGRSCAGGRGAAPQSRGAARHQSRGAARPRGSPSLRGCGPVPKLLHFPVDRAGSETAAHGRSFAAIGPPRELWPRSATAPAPETPPTAPAPERPGPAPAPPGGPPGAIAPEAVQSAATPPHHYGIAAMLPYRCFRAATAVPPFPAAPVARYTHRSAPGSGSGSRARPWEETLPEEVRRSLKTQQHAHPRTNPRPRSVSRFEHRRLLAPVGPVRRRCQN